MTRFLDTNILLYSVSTDPNERSKRDIAEHLLSEPDNALSVQVLQEFYVQATLATRPRSLTHDSAVSLIRTWLRFPVQSLTVLIMSDALDIKVRSGLSYWDAAIVAAARALGSTELLSEDMQHGRQIGGVKIVNPFQ
ncbi:MAG: PIN domain-containing protein [Burkholderiales bacterium]